MRVGDYLLLVAITIIIMIILIYIIYMNSKAKMISYIDTMIRVCAIIMMLNNHRMHGSKYQFYECMNFTPTPNTDHAFDGLLEK